MARASITGVVKLKTLEHGGNGERRTLTLRSESSPSNVIPFMVLADPLAPAVKPSTAAASVSHVADNRAFEAGVSNSIALLKASPAS